MSAIPTTFRAFVAEQAGATVNRGVWPFAEADLPPGQVEVRVLGGFHRSSQHLETEVVRDGCWQAAAGDPCDARPDVVARQAIDSAA